MTIQGAIKELDMLIDSEDIPSYYKPSLQKIKETVVMECEDMKKELIDCVPWNVEEKAMQAAALSVMDKHISGKESE